uniref:Uncharacterized protein n=1 Tax=Arundo donax TaxID=35708 RepID=A0A0A9GCI8_ARUDO
MLLSISSVTSMDTVGELAPNTGGGGHPAMGDEATPKIAGKQTTPEVDLKSRRGTSSSRGRRNYQPTPD